MSALREDLIAAREQVNSGHGLLESFRCIKGGHPATAAHRRSQARRAFGKFNHRPYSKESYLLAFDRAISSTEDGR